MMFVYAVLLHGINIPLSGEDGTVSIGGVYCWRFERAWTERQATRRAIRSLQDDPLFRMRVKADDFGRLEFAAEEVFRATPKDRSARASDLNTGLVFYREDENLDRSEPGAS